MITRTLHNEANLGRRYNIAALNMMSSPETIAGRRIIPLIEAQAPSNITIPPISDRIQPIADTTVKS